jgi:hypothetical protein
VKEGKVLGLVSPEVVDCGWGWWSECDEEKMDRQRKWWELDVVQV